MKARNLGVTVTLISVVLAGRATAQKPNGQSIFREECKLCHGVNGTPAAKDREKYKKIKAFGDDGFGSRLSVDSIVKILTKGIDKDMKSFKDKLEEPEMRAVAEYVKELGEKFKEKKP